MTDPFQLSQKSFAARALAAGDANVDAEAVDRFIMRVGRPVPVVLVLGSEMGALCLEFDRLGASAIGVDLLPQVLQLARRRYPIGDLRQGDTRALSMSNSTVDGVWAGMVLCRMPRVDAQTSLRELHRVMRMGALLSVDLLPGEGETLVESSYGPMLESRWSQDDFAAHCDALDMQLIETTQLDHGAARLLFRREY